MATLVTLSPYKTYATHQNAQRAFEKVFAHMDIRYIIMTNSDGRFFPVGLGEKAVQAQVHFHFCVVA